MTIYNGPKMSSAKAVTAAVGTILTALTTALATIQLVLDDDAVSAAEVGTVAAALVTMAGTIYGVWKTRNRVIEPAQGQDRRF